MDTPIMTVEPVTLTGKGIRLEPLAESHIPDLDYACKDPPDRRRSIWRYLLDSRIYRDAGMAGLVTELLARRARGSDFPFAVIDLKSGNAVGTTRFMEMQPENRVVEIGTWIGANYQPPGINPQTKYPMPKPPLRPPPPT